MSRHTTRRSFYYDDGSWEYVRDVMLTYPYFNDSDRVIDMGDHFIIAGYLENTNYVMDAVVDIFDSELTRGWEKFVNIRLGKNTDSRSAYVYGDTAVIIEPNY